MNCNFADQNNKDPYNPYKDVVCNWVGSTEV